MTRIHLALAFAFALAICAPIRAQSYEVNGSESSVPAFPDGTRFTSDDVAMKHDTTQSVTRSAVGEERDGESEAGHAFDSCSSDCDDSDSSSSLVIGDRLHAISTIKSEYRNWVGTHLGSASDTACYRETHIAKTCPLGYDYKLGTCWAQCPYSYPVECGMECIRQNDDCALEIITKISSVGQAVFSLAPYNVYGKFEVMSKAMKIALKCTKEMMGLVKALSKFIRNIQVIDPQTTQSKLLVLLYQTDNVVFDIPITIMTCTGVSFSDSLKYKDRLVNTIELILRDILANTATIASSWTAFKGFMKNVTLGDTIDSLNSSEITSLQSALESESNCGYDMKRLLDRAWVTVAEMRRNDPSISEDDIRIAIGKSNLVLYDIPAATNNCMPELIAESNLVKAYAARDTLRKGFSSIVNDLIKSGTSSNGTLLAANEYAYVIANKAASFYGVWDRTNIGGAISEFFQTICGPTEYVGEIDDGTAEEALGLKTVQDAFKSSSGHWSKNGDGSVVIHFKSVDVKDVAVNINSNGNQVDQVYVLAGQNVTWKSNVTFLGGKTLYLDRWRPGFLGIPNSNGGSLLLWVPRSTKGGHLQLTVKINGN
ncbi:uncharacterized protein CCR75_007729 [Bremia lactucae]|uniref:Uncharacterized protein n=1 Tax=Bremia lactucae TaxID=4779 RepID=A0A976NZ21_BRELC|nr:hypothetical protein CCR75_007729 [Bremia lactucae]